MENFSVIRLKDRPELKDIFAEWFHEKWGIPLEAYRDSMEECISGANTIPRWYGIMDGGRMIAGLGVIDNDFHDRKDLSPNICAVYVERDYRCRGFAGKMLDFVCRDMSASGIDVLYLVTDHTSFYERYGFEYLCSVRCDGEDTESRMYIHRMG